jgi:hypothetical protein
MFFLALARRFSAIRFQAFFSLAVSTLWVLTQTQAVRQCLNLSWRKVDHLEFSTQDL